MQVLKPAVWNLIVLKATPTSDHQYRWFNKIMGKNTVPITSVRQTRWWVKLHSLHRTRAFVVRTRMSWSSMEIGMSSDQSWSLLLIHSMCEEWVVFVTTNHIQSEKSWRSFIQNKVDGDLGLIRTFIMIYYFKNVIPTSL